MKADQDDFRDRKNDCRIAVCASYGLGDGLLFLIIANNLKRNGFHITFFSDYISQLQDWLPDIEVKSFPANRQDIEKSFHGYDLVIADAVSVITDAYPTSSYPKLARDYVFIGMSRFSRDLISDHNRRLLQKVKNKDDLDCLLQIAKCSGTVLSRLKPKLTMVDNIATFCHEVMNLKHVTKSNSLVPPDNLTYQKFRNRVIIHPDSTKEAKNWLPSQFLKLARYLKQDGWSPAFIVSPKEYLKRQSLVYKDFALPLFNSLSELASYIYESGIMIGTDSGIGHLASNLGLPTITIHRKRDPDYRWRPGWYIGKVVIPLVSVKIAGKYYWRRALPVRKVIATFKSLNKQIA